VADAINALAVAMTQIMTTRLNAVASVLGQRIAHQTLEPMLTRKQAAKHFRVAIRTIDTWMQQGYLPYCKLGHNVRFRWTDVQKCWDEKFKVVHRWEGDDD
jgi:excisionase family DNA binding protein